MAKTKETAHPGPLEFLPTDFERFRPELARDPIHNAARLEVRRKLDGFGKRLAKRYALAGETFVSRASLHHPYRFNAYKVETQFVYLSRSDVERNKIKKILGAELGADLDQNYVHTLITLEIHEHGLELALRVHQNAWWDGENLKRQAAREDARTRLAAALHALPGFAMRIHDFRREHPCETMTGAELVETFKYYKPGEHWLHIERALARADELVTVPGLESRLATIFDTLLPVYRAIRWSPENNFLFAGA
ncbi:MAG: hypothetical protein ACKVX7_11105 [Planctomycetota bacterium]